MNEKLIIPVIARFALGGGAVVASTVIARAFGGRIGGIFAAFPAVYLAAILSLGMEYKDTALLDISLQISQGALIGMFANIACAVAAHQLIIKKGWQKGLILALILWLIIASITFFAVQIF